MRDLAPLPLATRLAVSATQIAATTEDGITVWDRATFSRTVHEGDPRGSPAAIHPAGTWLATSDRGEVTLWRMPDFCPTARFAADPRFARAVVFHPTAPVLFLSGTDGAVHAFATDAPGEELAAVPVPDRTDISDTASDSMAITADGRLLVVPVYMRDDVAFFEIGATR